MSCQENKSDSIIYIGPNLPCTGIDTNDNLTLIIQKLNDTVCNFATSSTTSTSTTNAPTTTSTTSSSSTTTTSSTSTSSSTSTTTSSSTTTTTTTLAFRSLYGYISQTGANDPTLVIVSNNLGGTIQRNHIDVGFQELFFNSPTLPLTAAKTWVNIGCGSVPGFSSPFIPTTNDLVITTKNIAGVESDDILNNTPIEIRVYP